MPEMQIIDSVLPFKCGNQDCEKKYDLELFTEVMLLWGYIYLISEDDGFAIVGLTCPNCLQTTIRKCSTDEALLFNAKLKRQLNFQTNQYVHFSYSLLKQWNLIDIEHIKDKEDHPLFFLPQDTTQIHNTVDQQFGATEEALSFLCAIENEHRLKSIPRIVSHQSKYMVFDMIFKDETPFDLNETLVALIKPNSDKNIDNVSAKFSHMVSNNLTEEKYNNLDLDLFSHERKSFQQNIQYFLNDAKLVRNKIDFEVVYRDELINVYAEKMYYDPGVVKGKERESMESMEAIEEEGLVSEDVTLSSSPPANVTLFEDLGVIKLRSDAQMTPKEKVIQCCRVTAQKLVDQDPDITFPKILKTDEFKKSYEGKEDYIPGSDSGWRNWLKGIYSNKKGRKKGT